MYMNYPNPQCKTLISNPQCETLITIPNPQCYPRVRLLTSLESELTSVEDSSPSPHETMAAQLYHVSAAGATAGRALSGEEGRSGLRKSVDAFLFRVS
jgi:hypothetical protein